MLFSPDLESHILRTLEAEDAAAAAVCSQWLAGWKATNEPRRRLKHVRLDFAEELLTDEMQMAITPDGRLVARITPDGRLVARSPRPQTSSCCARRFT